VPPNKALDLAMNGAVTLWLAAALCCFANPASAEDPPAAEEKRFIQTVPGAILLAETLFAANAGMATLDPQAYGVLVALFSPLGAAETKGSTTTRWVALAAAEGLAAYNIAGLDKDEDTDKEIFVANMIAWHVFAAAVGTTAWLKGDLEESKKVTLSYAPVSGGGLIRIGYAF
jgi:hypothetical protein